MKVRNMTNKKTGQAIPNQFAIDDSGVYEYFQSYETIIIKKEILTNKTWLDINYWNCSTTTSRYRNQFLGETTKETQAKIDSGEYILADLN